MSSQDVVMKKAKSTNIGVIPALDGIRAIAVFIVVVSHAGLGSYIPGGLGVTVFFFLSGYLITTLLIKEFQQFQRINVAHFFVRRFFRLFPPLAVSLLLSYLLLYLDLLGGGFSFTGLLSQLFYLANYQQIYSWGGLSLTVLVCFGHLQSKSIFT